MTDKYLLDSKLDVLNDNIPSLNVASNPVKAFALVLEKKSYESVPVSEEANPKVNEVILNISNDLLCEICLGKGVEKKCKGGWGCGSINHINFNT
ncbi:hypothetical protein BpHYR1_041933 [Brachionus plicatilis]|uniref:Uncharacterized protein n=1 Tax=Brachionus plicatilis TaxID=10195 RepID=A0A3M7QNP5_BRAPC|nr:hypothetical protein BpHYR1_041933 [Brachionus plicatilis]